MDVANVAPASLPYKPPRRWISWTAVLLALTGWWLSLDLFKLSMGKTASTPWLQAECGADADPTAAFDCQSVLNSKHASFPLSDQPGAPRLPVSILGMGYFAFVGFWYLFVGAPSRKRWGWHLLITMVAVAGAAVSLQMVWIMHDELKKWCQGCLVVHAANVALLLLTIVAFPWRAERAARAVHPPTRLALAALAAASFLFLLHPAFALTLVAQNSAGRMYQAHMRIVSDPEFVRWHYERQPSKTQLENEQPIHAGDPQAPNTLVVFIDYQCPACKSAYEVIETVMEMHPGSLRVSYRHFPLDRACNGGVARSAHPAACRASRAAEAARIVGGEAAFRRMRNMLYERLNELEVADYVQWADEIGLDPIAFSKAFGSAEVENRIRSDIELGQQLGVDAIPVLFLNARRLEYWSRPDTWDALLQDEVAASLDTSALP